MSKSQEDKDFKRLIERIVFDEGELNELKIAISNFNKGIITPKQLKQNLLPCRSLMVEEVTKILIYSLNWAQISAQTSVESNFTNSNQLSLANDQLRQEIAERNELLEVIVKKLALSCKK